MNDFAFLTIIPLIFALLFVVSVSHFKPRSQSTTLLKEYEHSSETTGCSCNMRKNGKAVNYCYDSSISVLKGVDMVQYFTAFKLPDGSYNESEVGQLGLDQYSSSYNNYTYNFISEANLRIFEANPSAYIPQWGGFCAWGMSSEVCPIYGWSASCLGPSGNWATWTILHEKIYFFLDSVPKSYFMKASEDNIIAGDLRWADWFPNSNLAHMSTNCAVTSTVVVEDVKLFQPNDETGVHLEVPTDKPKKEEKQLPQLTKEEKQLPQLEVPNDKITKDEKELPQLGNPADKLMKEEKELPPP